MAPSSVTSHFSTLHLEPVDATQVLNAARASYQDKPAAHAAGVTVADEAYRGDPFALSDDQLSSFRAQIPNTY